MLRTSALALVHNTAEYCVPIWGKNVHANKVDVKINRTMSTESECVRSVNVQWLLVLSNITLQEIRKCSRYSGKDVTKNSQLDQLLCR